MKYSIDVIFSVLHYDVLQLCVFTLLNKKHLNSRFARVKRTKDCLARQLKEAIAKKEFTLEYLFDFIKNQKQTKNLVQGFNSFRKNPYRKKHPELADITFYTLYEIVVDKRTVL